MSGSKRAFGVRGFEPYEDNDYFCVVHGYTDRDGKRDNSIEVIVDGKKEKACPTCFYYKLNGHALNKRDSEIEYKEFKKDGKKFIPVK